MNDLFSRTGRIHAVHIEPLTLNRPFQSYCQPFAELPGTVILMSGGNLDCARFHILAALPWMTMTVKQKNVLFTVDGKSLTFRHNPFDALHNLIETLRLEGGLPEPVGAGLFGYLSYDLKDTLEKLPKTTVDDLDLPDLLLYAPSFVVVHDRQNKESRLCTVERILSDGTRLQPDTGRFMRLIQCPPTAVKSFSCDPTGLRSSFGTDEYLDAVEKIRSYITAGDVYQVNLSQRFSTSFTGNPYALFCTLFNRNPAPFFSYIHGGNHIVVSTSPERFLKRTGNRIETRPIKGTRPRGKNELEDRYLKEELTTSPKEDAELVMIVDLLRNDLGKVCAAGSVQVTEHKRVEAYQNVYHLVSRIEGELDKNQGSVNLICAAFPGGSVTGCPKVRAMEIIDELEPVRRHVYTGAIGYISFHDTMDLAIAIRTATIAGDTILFSVGGGIVYDSNPQQEYEESRQKGHTFEEVIEDSPKLSPETTYIWMNGKIVPAERATVSVTDPLVMYGYGLFETIRAQSGQILFLAEHLMRLDRSCRQLFGSPLPVLTWEDIIKAVLRENQLLEKVAAVKIMAGLRTDQRQPSHPVLTVQCRPYIHRLAETNRKDQNGLRLRTYPYSRQSSLADHKTLNHLDYILAGQWAGKFNADEALMLNPDQTISETNSAGIILVKGRKVFRPKSPHVLPSIMCEKVCTYLHEKGYEIGTKPLDESSLFLADQVLLANSLMGAVPVISLDDKPTGKHSRLWIEINDHLFQGRIWRENLSID